MQSCVVARVHARKEQRSGKTLVVRAFWRLVQEPLALEQGLMVYSSIMTRGFDRAKYHYSFRSIPRWRWRNPLESCARASCCSVTEDSSLPPHDALQPKLVATR